jgi:antitoxin YefM
MINGIKQRSVVGKDGRIEIQSSELPEGAIVEIIVLVESADPDETEYLFSTEANRNQLLQAIDRSHNSENLVVISSEEWNEKYHF